MATRAAALGFKVHTGWTAVVALAGPPADPELVAKRRIDMALTFDSGAVYHVSQKLPLAEAEALIQTSERAFEEKAREGIAALAAELRAAGLDPARGAVVSKGGRALPPLDGILRSHALVHAAEGAMYRRVVEHACSSCGIPSRPVPEADLAAQAARGAGLTAAHAASTLAAMGKASGAPWTVDQREAALAAWIALARAG